MTDLCSSCTVCCESSQKGWIDDSRGLATIEFCGIAVLRSKVFKVAFDFGKATLCTGVKQIFKEKMFKVPDQLPQRAGWAKRVLQEHLLPPRSRSSL